MNPTDDLRAVPAVLVLENGQTFQGHAVVYEERDRLVGQLRVYGTMWLNAVEVALVIDRSGNSERAQLTLHEESTTMTVILTDRNTTLFAGDPRTTVSFVAQEVHGRHDEIAR